MTQNPTSECIGVERAVNPLRPTKVFKNLRFAQGGVHLLEAEYDYLQIVFAWGSQREVVTRCGEGQDRMLAFRSDLQQPPIKPDLRDQPLTSAGEFVKRRHDDAAWNDALVFLPDDIVELTISDEVHAGISGGVR